jgi:hypothetical protein
MLSKPGVDMAEVVVGVVLTAVLGGLLVPLVAGVLDRRSERFRASVAQIDTLADCLWAYWKLAIRVAVYGKQKQGEQRSKDLKAALDSWDSEHSWEIGRNVQIQYSRSKRLFPSSVHGKLDRIQPNIVTYLDGEMERLRDAGTPDDWKEFYDSLMTKMRPEIDSLLTDMMRSLKIGGGPMDENLLARLYRRIRGHNHA